MVCCKIHFLRQTYDKPTTNLRQCSLLLFRVKLEKILAMECLVQAPTKCEMGEITSRNLMQTYIHEQRMPCPESGLPAPSSALLHPPSSLIPPPASRLPPPSSLPPPS